MANKVSIKRTKKTDKRVYDVSFSGLTLGEISALKNALEYYAVAPGSAVAGDVAAYIKNSIAASDDPDIKGV